MGIMPSASKFVAKFVSLRRPQYIGLRGKDYDTRGIPVRIWAWEDDDGIHVKVVPDSFGTVLYNVHTKSVHSEVSLRIFNKPVVFEESDQAAIARHVIDPNR